MGKPRNGPTWDGEVYFEKEYGRFRDPRPVDEGDHERPPLQLNLYIVNCRASIAPAR